MNVLHASFVRPSVRATKLQGWSTAYDFSVADLRAGSDVVSRIAATTDQSGLDWQQLLGLLQVIYGGRVDAEHDARVGAWHM